MTLILERHSELLSQIRKLAAGVPPRGDLEESNLSPEQELVLTHLQTDLWEQTAAFMTQPFSDLQNEDSQESISREAVYRIGRIMTGVLETPYGREIALSAALNVFQGGSYHEKTPERFAEIIHVLDPTLEITSGLVKTPLYCNDDAVQKGGYLSTEEKKGIRIRNGVVGVINSAGLLLKRDYSDHPPEKKLELFQRTQELASYSEDYNITSAWLNMVGHAVNCDSLLAIDGFQKQDVVKAVVKLAGGEYHTELLPILASKNITAEDLIEITECDDEETGELVRNFVSEAIIPQSQYGDAQGYLRSISDLLEKLPEDISFTQAAIRSVLGLQHSFLDKQKRMKTLGISQTDLGKAYEILKKRLDKLDDDERLRLVEAKDLIMLAKIHAGISALPNLEQTHYQRDVILTIKQLVNRCHIKEEVLEGPFDDDSEIIVLFRLVKLFAEHEPEFLAGSGSDNIPRWISEMRKMKYDYQRLGILTAVRSKVYEADENKFIHDVVLYGEESWLNFLSDQYMDTDAYSEAVDERNQRDFGALKEELSSTKHRLQEGTSAENTLCELLYDLGYLAEESWLNKEEKREWQKEAEEWRRSFVLDLLTDKDIPFAVKSLLDRRADLRFLEMDQARNILSKLGVDERLLFVEQVFCECAFEDHQPDLIIKAVNNKIVKEPAIAVYYLIQLTHDEWGQFGEIATPILVKWANGLKGKDKGSLTGYDIDVLCECGDNNTLRRLLDALKARRDQGEEDVISEAELRSFLEKDKR